MRYHKLLTIACLLGFVAAVPFGTQAQGQGPTSTCELDGVHCCGELNLVFLNPDLQPRSDGKIHAQGSFFAQFQAIGKDADKIKTFAFSFGVDPGVEFTAENVCDKPVWFSGQQLMFYRADQDPSDGFFINLQTNLVPDGNYAAAVHAYDASDKELARFWARAVVENCDANAAVDRCDDAGVNRMDKTMPWPIMLPGDGQLPEGETGFTIEFAEKLHPSTPLTVYLNNEDITGQLEEWEGREWDNNYLPGYLPYGLNNEAFTQCADNPAQQCVKLGKAYRWSVRELTDDDVLRVEAMDDSIHMNVATKDIHIGSSVTGGAISDLVPNLNWQFDKIAQQIDPTSGTLSAIFKARLTNSGGADGHPFANTEGPEGWEFEWNPPHVPVPPGATTEQELTVTVPTTVGGGDYQVNASMRYTAAGTEKVLQQVVTVTVLGEAAEVDPDALAQEQDDDKKDSPGVGLVLLLGLVAGIAAIYRRR